MLKLIVDTLAHEQMKNLGIAFYQVIVIPAY